MGSEIGGRGREGISFTIWVHMAAAFNEVTYSKFKCQRSQHFLSLKLFIQTISFRIFFYHQKDAITHGEQCKNYKFSGGEPLQKGEMEE